MFRMCQIISCGFGNAGVLQDWRQAAPLHKDNPQKMNIEALRERDAVNRMTKFFSASIEEANAIVISTKKAAA